MTLWLMRIACRIPNATNAYSEYVIRIDFRIQQWLHERTSMLSYMYIAYLVFICIYSLFNDIVSSPDYIVWDGWLAVDSKLCITW